MDMTNDEYNQLKNAYHEASSLADTAEIAENAIKGWLSCAHSPTRNPNAVYKRELLEMAVELIHGLGAFVAAVNEVGVAKSGSTEYETE